MPDMGYENHTNKWLRNRLKSTAYRNRYVNEVVSKEGIDRKRNKAQQEDTDIRMKMQKLIIKRLAQGCTKEQILEVLQSEPKFAKFSSFFESYINNYLKKYDRER